MDEKEAPGAIITSKNRKVQLEFNDGRAQTAGKAISRPSAKAAASEAIAPAVTNRPNTIEGIAPAPPASGKVSRSYRTLSPREVSLIAQPNSLLEKSQESSGSWIKEGSRPATSATSGRPMSVQYSRGSRDAHAAEGIAANAAEGSRPSSSWQRVDVDPMMPSFLKRHRLANQREGAAEAPVNPPMPIAAAEEDIQRRNMLLDRLKVPQQMSGRELAQSQQQQAWNFHVKSEFFRRHIKSRTGKQSKFDSTKLRKLGITERSVATVSFQQLEFEDVVRYLWDLQKKGPSHVEFVHVTCRSNIEKVFRENFYDIVALERPGHPNSGYVWSRDVGKYAFNNHVLPRHKVMQLSLNGLLITNEIDEQPEIIPLEEFFLERDQMEFLRTGSFFGYFKELKAFSAWKTFTQHSYVQRMKKLLLKNTFFSDMELVRANQLVIRTVYELETQTDLFCFAGKGLVYIEDFLKKQMDHIDEIRAMMHQKIQALGDAVAATYHEYMTSKKLEDLIREVKEHHPLREVMEKTDETVDWIKLRSVQRLGENYKQKVRGILYAAQYRIEFAIANIVEKFWLRMKQSVIGVHQVKGDRKTANPIMWELKKTLFDTTGKLVNSAFDENLALVSIDTVDASEEANTVTTTTNNNKAMVKEDNHAPPREPGSPHAPPKQYMTAEEREENRLRKLGNPEQKKVAMDWEKQGVHLATYVHLFFGDRILDMKDLLTLRSAEKVRVQIAPSKPVLMNQVHMVCGQLGRMFETLPNLKHHSLLVEQTYKTSYLDSEVDLGLGELENAQSSVYFTFLVMFPSYNSRYAYSLAIETMKLFTQAYQEAMAVEFYTFKLAEIFRKLWSLSPTALIKQMDRSFALTKIKDFIDRPDMIEDLRRTQVRDKNRLATFTNAVVYLTKLPQALKFFANIKHRMGFITSFYPILDQLKRYRTIQDYYLYVRLPNTYVTRCSLFYDFVRKLESIFETEGKTLADDIRLMQRIKNFEWSKECFDAELEICHAMFHTHVAHANRQLTSEETVLTVTVEQMLAGSKGRSHAQALTPEKLNAVVLEALERLVAALSRCRSNLLAKLPDIRNEVLITRQALKTRINDVRDQFQTLDITDAERAVEETNQVMTNTGKEMEALHRHVEESVTAQFVLSEAHDIVGAANPIMTAHEIDRLDDMLRLEVLYNNRCAAWKIMVECEAIVRQTIASKLANVGIAELNANFVKLVEMWEKLSTQLDDAHLIAHIDKLIKETRPKVELVSYFSTKTLRPRHWTWMGKNIFRPCHFDIKLTGRQLEFVTVVDTKGKDPVGLGNINRLPAAEVLNR